jgi:hypothetical protein
MGAIVEQGGANRCRLRVAALGTCAAEGIEAKRVGKEPSLAPLLRTVAVATAGKTGTKWDFSPRVAADVVLPRRPLVIRPIEITTSVWAEPVEAHANPSTG